MENSWNAFNCEINFDLNSYKICVIVATDIETQCAIFSINNTKIYVQVVILSTQDNAKLLEQLKSGLKKQLTRINIS